MPLRNYCKKCKAEVPAGETCPLCYGKLTQAGQRLSFGLVRTPARDWFAWNQALRVILPTLLLVTVITLWLEGSVSGRQGIQAVFMQGFLGALLGALGLMLLLMLVLFCLQGKESVHYVLDKDGVHAYTYLDRPARRKLYARFLTWASAQAMQKEELAVKGFLLVKRVDLPWSQIRRVRCWRETYRILFFKPAWWQVLAMACPPTEYAEAEALVRKKLSRGAKVFPPKDCHPDGVLRKYDKKP